MMAVQFFLPGEPQVYYVGLLNGMDDTQLFERTAQGRDVNRHHYTLAEIAEALEQPVTQAIIALARLRKHPAFEGQFSWKVLGGSSMSLDWVNGDEKVSLEINTNLAGPSFQISLSSPAGTRSLEGVSGLASY
jgi:sucrose phosphorylase